MFDGTPPSNCADADAGTLLAEFDLAENWAADAADGILALSDMPLDAVAVADGALSHYRLYASDGVCHAQGTITETGDGGDITVGGLDVAWGQGLTIPRLRIKQPGA
jgi:hypothetical protein